LLLAGARFAIARGDAKDVVRQTTEAGVHWHRNSKNTGRQNFTAILWRGRRRMKFEY
jgi:hypothetical protein